MPSCAESRTQRPVCRDTLPMTLFWRKGRKGGDDTDQVVSTMPSRQSLDKGNRWWRKGVDPSKAVCEQLLIRRRKVWADATGTAFCTHHGPTCSSCPTISSSLCLSDPTVVLSVPVTQRAAQNSHNPNVSTDQILSSVTSICKICLLCSTLGSL